MFTVGCLKAPFLDHYLLTFTFAAFANDKNQFLHQCKNINDPNNIETKITLKNRKKTFYCDCKRSIKVPQKSSHCLLHFIHILPESCQKFVLMGASGYDPGRK